LSQANRIETMAEKLAVYATRAGVADVALVTDAYHLAMPPRLAQLHDVFHPDLLHPARTALILIENAGCNDAHVLAAAELTETLAPQMRIAPAEIEAALGHEVVKLVRAVPDPLTRTDTLLEELVTADHDVALIALAERLDHARHLHMRASTDWQSYFDQTVSVYLPLAERVNAELARRFERWATAFQRRLA
jgi:(p)ppGpp synthase/HD superfamily hydrolase